MLPLPAFDKDIFPFVSFAIVIWSFFKAFFAARLPPLTSKSSEVKLKLLRSLLTCVSFVRLFKPTSALSKETSLLDPLPPESLTAPLTLDILISSFWIDLEASDGSCPNLNRSSFVLSAELNTLTPVAVPSSREKLNIPSVEPSAKVVLLGLTLNALPEPTRSDSTISPLISAEDLSSTLDKLISALS